MPISTAERLFSASWQAHTQGLQFRAERKIAALFRSLSPRNTNIDRKYIHSELFLPSDIRWTRAAHIFRDRGCHLLPRTASALGDHAVVRAENRRRASITKPADRECLQAAVASCRSPSPPSAWQYLQSGFAPPSCFSSSSRMAEIVYSVFFRSFLRFRTKFAAISVLRNTNPEILHSRIRCKAAVTRPLA